MDIAISPGRYVLAVSGGVDSMVLLDLLWQQPGVDLIVAHYDHGIREDSDTDRKLVQDTCKRLGVQFVYDEGRLGEGASEAVARNARYEFLEKVCSASKSQGIITAHHEDDLIETAIINMLRGTGRLGMTSMKKQVHIKRPLLSIPKQQVKKYAKDQGIEWREDSTNSDTKYLRNYIRHNIVPKLSSQDRKQLLDLIDHTHGLNKEIDEIIMHALHVQPSIDALERHWFIMLPHAVANEVMATWLKRHKVKDVDKKTITRLVAIARTSPNNRVADIDKNHILEINPKELKITSRHK